MGTNVIVYSGDGMAHVEGMEHTMAFEYREIDGQGCGECN